MEVTSDISQLRELRHKMRGTVGLTPTMGALHQGHIALVEAAHAKNDYVISTIFVNPLQFGANEDLSSYPRDLDADLAIFEEAGADLVFTPTPDVMYSAGFQTYVSVEQVSQSLEGQHRPGHFRGVTTVVLKLFNQTQPTRAYFGQKDAQQLILIRRMVHDLNVPVEIVPCPTVRETDGLAMSSRNRYLNAEERQAATVLYRALQSASKLYADGERRAPALEECMQEVFHSEPLAQPEYATVVAASDLQPVTDRAGTPLLALIAARVGKARLIDNCLLPFELNASSADLKAVLGSID